MHFIGCTRKCCKNRAPCGNLWKTYEMYVQFDKYLTNSVQSGSANFSAADFGALHVVSDAISWARNGPGVHDPCQI